MASDLVVILGDDPAEITSDGSNEFTFGFPENPDPDRPAMLLLNVQNLIEPAEVELNGSSIGFIYPTLGFSVQNTLTSPTYDNYTIYMQSPRVNLKVNEFLKDVSVGSMSTSSDDYWATQMININMADKLNKYSASSTEGTYEAEYESRVNRLKINSVSQTFRVKDIFLTYPVYQ